MDGRRTGATPPGCCCIAARGFLHRCLAADLDADIKLAAAVFIHKLPDTIEKATLYPFLDEAVRRQQSQHAAVLHGM